MSITDGQLVLKDQQQESESSSETIERGRKLQLDALASLSRMGTRAHPLALKDLAPKVWPTIAVQEYVQSPLPDVLEQIHETLESQI